MSSPNTNELSYNLYIQTLAGMAVYTAAETSGVWAFTDAPPQLQVPMILNYAELRIQRDLNLTSAMTSNTYTLTAGVNIFALPVNDFFAVETLEIVQLVNGQAVNSTPLLFTSKEFIQNCYGGLSSAGTPQYAAMYGDNWQSPGQFTNTNILLGPPPNFAYTIRVTGTSVMQSLYTYAVNGLADTQFTYLSAYYPDLLIMASMIYISAFQRNFSATSADVEMSMSYEKQYLALKASAVMEEDQRKQQGSGWTAYSTPVSATPTR